MVFKAIIILAAVHILSIQGKAVLSLDNPGETTLKCKQEPRDIFLLIDGSSSVGKKGFAKVREFLLNLIKNVDVREEMTHFGLLQFSTKAKTKVEFYLDDSHDSNVLLDKVRNIKYHSGLATYTGHAMSIVEKEVFTEQNDDRPHVQDVLIIFTDGKPTDYWKALEMANKLKKRNVRIVAIAAGPRRKQFLVELEMIASTPSDVILADFDHLDDIIDDIVDEICLEPPSKPTSLMCSQEPRDVFLVVDGSLSIGDTAFEKIKKFILALIRFVVVNPDMTHFGMLQFSSLERTRVEFSLDYSHKEAVLLNTVGRLRYLKGDATFTGNAIRIVDQEVFTIEGDDRPDVQDILIVFTDGATRDQPDAIHFANNLKARGVHIIAIGAGEKRMEFRHQLVEIASNETDVLMVEFDDLNSVIGSLINKVCKLRTTSAPPTTTPIPTTTPEPTTTREPTTTPKPTTTPLPTTTPPTTIPTTILPTTTAAPPVCADYKLDVLIMVDNPINISPRKYQIIKRFLKQLVSRLPVNNDNFLVGIMVLGDDPNPPMYVKFTENMTTNILFKKIQQIRRRARITKMHHDVFSAARTALHKLNYQLNRVSAPDVVILLTTRGVMNPEKIAEAEELFQLMRVAFITITTGRQRHQLGFEPQFYRSGTLRNHYVSTIRKLTYHVEHITKDICPPKNILGATLAPIPICQRTPYDIFFVVDGSASIRIPNFAKVRHFLMDLLTLLGAGLPDINMGFLQFSQVEKTKILLDLDRYSFQEQMKFIDNMEYQAGRKTMTGDALSRLEQWVFNGQGGDRPDVQNVLIIFTDGNAHDLLVALEQARLLKKSGIRIITIAAGVKEDIYLFQEELKEMASDPVEDFISVDFEDLSGFANRAFPLICDEIKKL